MNNQNFMYAAGIMILFIFVAAISFSGCIGSGCGVVNNVCCENHTCNSSDLVCVENKCTNFKLDMLADKELYKSNENVNFTLIVYSSTNLNNVEFKVYGITNFKRKYQLNTVRTVNLTSGRNVNSIMFTLPACNKCAGISPGTHKIYADLVYNGTVVSNTTKDIELQQ